MAARPRIGFAGTPEFAVPALAALHQAAEVPFVLTQPDRRAGRGRKAQPSPVKQLAEQLSIPVYQPEDLRRPELPDALGPAPDLLVVVAYGLLLPEKFLRWPARGAVNIHASLLPRWRGAAPIQRALIAGDPETGVSIMQMERGLDTGPVFGCRAIPIGPAATAADLTEQLAALGAELLLSLLPGILSGERQPQPQDATRKTLAPKLEKSEALLNWQDSAALCARKVRAFNPWPMAETRSGELRLRIHAAEALDRTPSASVGTVVSTSAAGIDVACGEGVLRLTCVQASGGRAMSAQAFLNGRDVQGVRFEGPPD
jgi:methionyl-tRNA formyltransferase